jgi:hypothetical protein
MKPDFYKKPVPKQSEQTPAPQVELVRTPVYDIDEYLKDLEENSGSQANNFQNLLSASSKTIYLKIDWLFEKQKNL